MTLLLLALLALPPRPASYVAATLIGRPDLGERLEAVCDRESRCLPLGVHPKDAGRGSEVYENARRVGLLCPTHRRRRARRWSTRGAWGTMAGYTLRYMPGALRCLPPEVLDVPIVGAFAAALRLEASENEGAHPMLVAWGRP